MSKKEKNLENNEDIADLAREEKINELDILKQSLEEAKKDSAEHKDKFVRINAEFVNFKNRMEREKLEFLKYANSNVLKDFLPFLDSFESALKAEHKDLKECLSGFNLLFESFLSLCKKEGLERIDSVGLKFDHNLHDAVGFDKNDDYEDDIVTLEMQKGYKLKDKVLRHSMVKVNKK